MSSRRRHRESVFGASGFTLVMSDWQAEAQLPWKFMGLTGRPKCDAATHAHQQR
jgi:hypothetical protein